MMPNTKKTDDFKPMTPAPMVTPQTGMSRAVPATPRASERNGPSVIGFDLLISGNLLSKGEILIDGEIQGDIFGTNVVVGERARITGNIIAEEIVVRGHVMGSVRGKRIMLQTTSHVEGDIYHKSLAIEQGAFFEGKSRRSEDPMAGIARPEMPVPTPGYTS